MSSTNKTTYYELPQFVDNDIFNPLVDDNDAYSKIDTALHNIAGAEADDASEIVGVKSRLDSAEGDIDALETQNGDNVLTTTAQTLSGAVNELDADVSALDGRLDIAEDDINNASTGLKAKVASLETTTNSLYHGNLEDGSLGYDKLSAVAKKFLEDNAKIIFMEVSGTDGGNCTVVITKHGKVVMLDSGFSQMYDNIKAQLAENNITRVDYFLLSHYHGDHFGNIASMVQDGYIDNNTICYLPRRTNDTDWNTNDDNIRLILADMEKIVYSSDTPLEVDGFTFTFFNCDASDYADYEAESITNMNVYCVCTYVEYKEFTLLMTGDCTDAGLVHSEPYFKKVDILQVPHHGYRSDASSDLLLLTETRPDYAVVFMPKRYYTSDDDYLRSSERMKYIGVLGIKTYMMGLSNVYVGVGDNIYDVMSPSLPINPTKYETLTFYVDKSFTGIGTGSKEKPFNSITQAMGFVSSLGVGYRAILEIVDAYDGSDETINMVSAIPVLIRGTKNGDSYNVKLSRCVVENSFVFLDTIELVYDGNSSALNAYQNANVHLNNVLFSGNTTSYNNTHEGVAIRSGDLSRVIAMNTTINNHNIPFYVENMGTIFTNSCHGTGNNHIGSGNNGDALLVIGGDLTCTGFRLGRRYSGNAPMNTFRNGNDNGVYYGYSATSPAVAYTSVHSSESTDIVNLSDQCYYNRIFKIICINGAEYQCYRKDSPTHISTPIQTAQAVDSSDNTFAVTLSAQDTLSITHSSMVKIIAI